MKNKYSVLLLPISGVLTGLCTCYFVPAALEWFSIAPFLFVIFGIAGEKIRLRRGLRLGFLYFYPYYLTVWHWFLLMYPLEFTGLSKLAAFGAVLAAWLGLPLVQAVVAMWQVPLFYAAARSGFAKKPLYPAIFAAGYALFEWIQTLTWAGVPWGRLAIGQAYTPIFVRSAALFGSYFVAFALVFVNGCVALAARHMLGRENREAVLSIGLAGVMFALNLTLGGLVTLTHSPDAEGSSVTAAALQGNISSADKWKDSSITNVMSVYKRLTDAAASDGADVVVWTESSLPYTLNQHQFMLEFVEDLAKENDITLFASSFWCDFDTDATYNAVLNVSPETGINTDVVYKKQRLVPFGEFVPYKALVEKLFPPLAGLSMFGSDVSTGDGACVAETECGKVGNLICFDSIYETYALVSAREGAELIAISTNDSWFGQSAALYQHTAQAILRAIETDRYVIRAANTGYTCVISPEGEIIDALPIDEEGYLVSEVSMRSTRTVYSVLGNLAVWIFAAAIVFLCTDAAVSRFKSRKSI